MFEAALTAQKKSKMGSWTREILEKAWTIFCPFQAEDTRPDASWSHKTRLHFPFYFSFWFRWLESQSSQLQIRNRDPPIDDPHMHCWVHVTKKRQNAIDWLLGDLFLREAREKLEYALSTVYVWQSGNSKSEGVLHVCLEMDILSSPITLQTWPWESCHSSNTVMRKTVMFTCNITCTAHQVGS